MSLLPWQWVDRKRKATCCLCFKALSWSNGHPTCGNCHELWREAVNSRTPQPAALGDQPPTNQAAALGDQPATNQATPDGAIQFQPIWPAYPWQWIDRFHFAECCLCWGQIGRNKSLPVCDQCVGHWTKGGGRSWPSVRPQPAECPKCRYPRMAKP